MTPAIISEEWGGDNWQDNGLVFKMKATSRLVGNLRFGFSLFGAAGSDLPKNWKVVWSNDNINWNEGAQILDYQDRCDLGSRTARKPLPP